MRDKVCAFSGHRRIYHIHSETLPQKLSYVIDTLTASGVTHFLSGGAQGFDLLAAEYVLGKRKTNPDIKLSMYLPCRSQSDRWPAEIRRQYEAVIGSADEVFYTSDKYDMFCMHKRNRALVDNSDILVCYLFRDSGGTAYTKNYAEEKGRKIINIPDLIEE